MTGLSETANNRGHKPLRLCAEPWCPILAFKISNGIVELHRIRLWKHVCICPLVLLSPYINTSFPLKFGDPRPQTKRRPLVVLFHRNFQRLSALFPGHFPASDRCLCATCFVEMADEAVVCGLYGRMRDEYLQAVSDDWRCCVFGCDAGWLS